MNKTNQNSIKLSSDDTIFWQHGFITINLTLVANLGIMLFLVIVSRLITRTLITDNQISRWQCLLEMVVTGIFLFYFG